MRKSDISDKDRKKLPVQSEYQMLADLQQLLEKQMKDDFIEFIKACKNEIERPDFLKYMNKAKKAAVKPSNL